MTSFNHMVLSITYNLTTPRGTVHIWPTPFFWTLAQLMRHLDIPKSDLISSVNHNSSGWFLLLYMIINSVSFVSKMSWFGQQIMTTLPTGFPNLTCLNWTLDLHKMAPGSCLSYSSQRQLNSSSCSVQKLLVPHFLSLHIQTKGKIPWFFKTRWRLIISTTSTAIILAYTSLQNLLIQSFLHSLTLTQKPGCYNLKAGWICHASTQSPPMRSILPRVKARVLTIAHVDAGDLAPPLPLWLISSITHSHLAWPATLTGTYSLGTVSSLSLKIFFTSFKSLLKFNSLNES